MTEREQAWEILRSVDEGAFAIPLLEAIDGERRDVNFIRTLVLGVLRWRLRLDYIIEKLAGRRASKIDSIPLQLLRMGIYQIMFMEVPSYAAVSETVTLSGRHAARAKGFVNAVLRKATGTELGSILPEAGESEARLSVEFAHPEWLVQRWIRLFGYQRTRAILTSNQKLSHPDLLVNEQRISIEQAEELLREKQIAFERSSIVHNVLKIEGGTSNIRDDMSAGRFYAMDESSALVATLVDVHGGKVLDMAAAPGGKSLVMTLRGGEVTSNDVSMQRINRLRRLHRAFSTGEQNFVVSDGRSVAFRREAFRTILLDAPCSATGTIRKSPEIKWRLTPDAIGSFAALQIELLTSALSLEPEVCVYSTCSLEPEENDEVIAAVLDGGFPYAISDAGVDAPSGATKWIRNGVLRITPESGADGFTAFVLRRRRE